LRRERSSEQRDEPKQGSSSFSTQLGAEHQHALGR
jgi:hypothetical protein